jgi:hypothetical protein
MTDTQAHRGQGSSAAAPAQGAQRRGRPSKNPKVTYTCELCGTTKTVYQHHSRAYRFCSQTCNLINARAQRKPDPLAASKKRHRRSNFDKQRRAKNHEISRQNMHKRGQCALHPIYNNGQTLEVTPNTLPMFAWDHIDRTTKTASVAKLKDRNPQTLQNEIDKCQLLCHNCHAMKSREHNDHYPIDKPVTS